MMSYSHNCKNRIAAIYMQYNVTIHFFSETKVLMDNILFLNQRNAQFSQIVLLHSPIWDNFAKECSFIVWRATTGPHSVNPHINKMAAAIDSH